MNYSTYGVKPTLMVKRVLDNIPLLMKYKKQICESYLLYNIETGCCFKSPDGERYQLYLGKLLNLWSQKGSKWHFFNRGNYEIFTYNMKQVDDKMVLCWGWNVQYKEVNVFIIKDEIPNGTFMEMNEMLSSSKCPIQPSNKTEDWIYTLPSIYSVKDFLESIQTNVDIFSVFEKSYKECPEFFPDGTYLYPSKIKSKKNDFYAKTFDKK